MKRFSRSCFFIICAYALTACVPMPLSQPVSPISPEKVESFKPYASGVVMEKRIGEPLVGYNLLLTVNAYPGFVATEDFQLPPLGEIQTPMVKKGSNWKAIGSMEGGTLIVKNHDEPFVVNYSNPLSVTGTFTSEICIAVNAAGEPYGTSDCRTTMVYVEAWETKPNNFFKPTTVYEKDAKAWREAVIIYAGKTKGSIRLLYRETALNDMEFTFDLSEGSEIAIKDIVFDVLEATNTYIKYVIKTPPEELKSRIQQRQKLERI